MTRAYVRPVPADPEALRAATAALKESNDRLAANLARESVTGLCVRLEADNRRRGVRAGGTRS